MTDETSQATGQKESLLQAFVCELMRADDRLYGIVDAARDWELASAARERFHLDSSTLFEGPLASYLPHVAPHLVPIDVESGYLELWSEHLGRSAGILLITDTDPQTLWNHLRGIFLVTDEEDEEYTFRYYDPRVLRPFLPTFTAEEANELFGPIRLILVEAEQPGTMISCEPDPVGVRIEEFPLHAGGSGARGGGAKQ